MIDKQTGDNVTVHTDGTAGPYIPIGLNQLDRVTSALNRLGFQYTVDRDAVRLDGEAVTAVVNLGDGADVDLVQAILDAMSDEPEINHQERITRLQQTAARAVARGAIDVLTPSIFGLSVSLIDLIPKYRAERKKSIEERKTELVKELNESGIDPVTFDILLTNEMDRKLKIHFGITFLFLTVAFTGASYAIVILDAIYEWNLSQVAVTALIIETPIQFIGLLYVIARNLFPNTHSGQLTERSREHNRRATAAR